MTIVATNQSDELLAHIVMNNNVGLCKTSTPTGRSLVESCDLERSHDHSRQPPIIKLQPPCRQHAAEKQCYLRKVLKIHISFMKTVGLHFFTLFESTSVNASRLIDF